ncbi:hypothetical protein [Pseudoalteromonas sp. SG45-1]|jgi:hypothetical protein|uniref:hypothetical protein n=1 Tax=Pseudoalteromonas sp. SG45-1 TaxID=2760957 RepID=UPI0015FF1151|nr:hypothetical protein [Pseudoalteromonas sp. SG45-1]MBB1401274.1 hypothetical protein [Pseudoalteromonas sp. SG45-1]
MKQLMISIYLIFTSFCTEAISNDDKTYVSFDVIEMNVERVNDNLFRWIKFHPDSEFPCLRLEILEAGSNALIKRKNICNAYDEALKVTHDFKKLSFLDIYNLSVESQTLTFELELSLLSQNVVNMNCSIKIENKDFSPLVCNRSE